MGLTMQERHAVVRELSSRFQRSSKKERGQILNNFVQLTQVRQFEGKNGDSGAHVRFSAKSLHYILFCIAKRSGGRMFS